MGTYNSFCGKIADFKRTTEFGVLEKKLGKQEGNKFFPNFRFKLGYTEIIYEI